MHENIVVEGYVIEALWEAVVIIKRAKLVRSIKKTFPIRPIGTINYFLIYTMLIKLVCSVACQNLLLYLDSLIEIFIFLQMVLCTDRFTYFEDSILDYRTFVLKQAHFKVDLIASSVTYSLKDYTLLVYKGLTSYLVCVNS